MKKSIRPPENWQDFETLCKRLFGETWGCSNTIKKNGRLGQPQSGIDIYGVPKGESEYWGIQCKGKDSYQQKKLTKREIESEIAKAREFQPPLKTFAIATTAAKDVGIEEFVRQKDVESRVSGSFEIILYAWEDIADLIEENRDTYHWYVNEVQFRDKYDVTVEFDHGGNECVVRPKFLCKTTHYQYDPVRVYQDRLLEVQQSSYLDFLKLPRTVFDPPDKINHSWCSFTTRILNSGGMVLDDWRLTLFFPDTVRCIDDDFNEDIRTMVIRHSSGIPSNRTTWACDDNSLVYEPLNKDSLIQKDSRSFKAHFIPRPNIPQIEVKWELLARDFDKEGVLTFKVEPEFEEKTEIVYVAEYSEIQEPKEEILEFIEKL